MTCALCFGSVYPPTFHRPRGAVSPMNLYSKSPLRPTRTWQRWKRQPKWRLPLAIVAFVLLAMSGVSFLSRKRRPMVLERLAPWETLYATANISSQAFAKNIIVSEVNRLIFCPIPKAANSNWKYLLRKWEGLPDYNDLAAAHSPLRSKMRYLSDYSPSEAAQLLSDPTYFRFAFVRDPYSRLVSCYMDKFRNVEPEYVKREYRSFLAQLFSWHYARAIDIQRAPRPSFEDFVDELLKHDPEEMNAHWKAQTLLCGFGIIPYDFIGRMEHLTRDVKVVFDRLGRSDEHFPSHADIGFPPSGASREVADSLYTIDLMFKVRAMYDEDFRRLGYV